MKHTLSALLRDHPGALNRAVSLFRRRGYNIDTLHVTGSPTPGISQLTLIVDAESIDKVVKQLDRLIDVLKVEVVGDVAMKNGDNGIHTAKEDQGDHVLR